MEPMRLSDTFEVRKLGPEDVEFIYNLSIKNTMFYQYHPPMVTRESILEDMKALPPGKEDKDKFYIGFFEKESLAAVMDLVLGYPEQDICYIGLFMVDINYQNQRIGSKIIQECSAYLRTLGYNKIRLGVDRNNPQSNSFWKKNGFMVIEEGKYIIMEFQLRC